MRGFADAVLAQVDAMVEASEQHAAWQLASYMQSAEEAQRGWATVRAALAQVGERGAQTLPAHIAAFAAGPQRKCQCTHEGGKRVSANPPTEQELSLQAELQACKKELASYRTSLVKPDFGNESASHGDHKLGAVVQGRALEQLHNLLAESYEEALRLQMELEEERRAHALLCVTYGDLLQRQRRRPDDGSSSRHHQPSAAPAASFFDDTLGTARRVLSSTHADSSYIFSKAPHEGRAGEEEEEGSASGADGGGSALSYDGPRRPGAYLADAAPVSSFFSASEEDVWNMTEEVLTRFAGRSRRNGY